MCGWVGGCEREGEREQTSLSGELKCGWVGVRGRERKIEIESRQTSVVN